MDEQELQRILAKSNQDQAKEITRLISELRKAPILSASQIKRVNDSLTSLTKNLKLNEGDQKKLNEVISDLLDAKRKELEATKTLNNRFYTLFRSFGKNELAAQSAADAFTGAAETTVKLGKAAYKGTGTLTEFTEAFKDRLGLIGIGLQNFGNFADTSLDAFRTLSNVGANFGQNLFALRETAASAALPLQDFVKLISANSESLALLYGNTTQGAKRFSQLSEQFRRTSIERLAPLGFTVDQLNEVLLTTLTLQRRTGNFVEDSAQDQIASAERLGVELDKLSKLTGQQRTALAKQIESQLANERFTAFLTTQTGEAGQRLSAFAASINGLAPGLTEGFQDLIANSGVPVTESARMLVQNIPEASGIIQQLTAGTIDSVQALKLLRDAAQRSNKSLAGVAVTGQVGFARLFSEVGKLANAKLNETELTDEQREAQKKATESLALFEDSTKRLSASFQSIETGFYTVLGGFIGTTGNQLNNGIKDIADGIDKLDNGTKALLFMSKTIGGFFLDKGGQIAIHAAGTAAGIRLAGGGMGGAGGVGDLLGGKIGTGLKIGAGLGAAAGMAGGTAMAYQADTSSGKLAGALTSAGSGALLGATIGSAIPVIGTGIGAAIGGGIGLVSGIAGGIAGADIDKSKRATGTYGELGLPFEPKTSMLHVEAGERVLNRQETQEYNKEGQSAAQYAQLTSQMTQYNMTAKEALELQKANYKALNTLVSINAATEKNTKKTSKVVDKVGPSIV
jgi:hypothetical protein